MSVSSLDQVLPDNTIILTNPITQGKVYLIGTSHISQKSVEDVRRLVQLVNPDEVFIELCEARQESIQESSLLEFKEAIDDITKSYPYYEIKEKIHIKEKELFRDTKESFNLLKTLYETRSSLTMMILVLSSAFVNEQSNMVPGSEMKVAVIEGIKCGATYILGDRPHHITLVKLIMELSFSEKMRMLFDAVLSFLSIRKVAIEDVKSPVYIEKIRQDIMNKYPTLFKHYILERDIFMAEKLKQCRGANIVAVVGCLHMKGIEENWSKDNDIVPLLSIPSPFYFSQKKTISKTKILTITSAVVSALYTVYKFLF